jgi:hypothetical protein
MFLLLDWANSHPGRIVWIAGNHDIAFSHDEQTGDFTSSVKPSEFLDVLNCNDSLKGFRQQIGKFFIDLSNSLPRAILFPDGTLVTHGGFPLVDKQESAKSLATKDEFVAWLNTPECLQDFTWARISRYPKRQPNRSSKGCSYGFKDFESLCSLQPLWLQVKRMITGHEHPETGWEDFPTYQINPAVTINGFGFDAYLDAPAKFRKYKPRLVVGRCQRDRLPQKIGIEYDITELAKIYPPVPTEILPETSADTPEGEEISIPEPMPLDSINPQLIDQS